MEQEGGNPGGLGTGRSGRGGRWRSDPTMGGPGATAGRGEPKDPLPTSHCVTSGGQLRLGEGQMVAQGHKHREGVRVTERKARRGRKNSQFMRVTKNPHYHCSSVPKPSPHHILIMLWSSPQVSPCPSGWETRNRG